ncbi:hypothetical protein FQN60_012551, partial [Etheostoma spectabile]
MSSTAASGFVVFLLSVPVMQGQNWKVTYNPPETCVLKGSTVEISCTYRYPSRINGRDTAVEKTIWFTRVSGREPVDLRADSEYSGRVQYHCGKNSCTLTISDLRERDSAEYKFMFTTNQPGGSFAGEPGVPLSVTDPDMQVHVHVRSKWFSSWPELKCHSRCRLPGHPSYVWYKNGQKVQKKTSDSYSASFDPADSFSCAVRGHEDFPSPSVYQDQVESKFWFSPERNRGQNPSQPGDLSKDPQYSGRVQVKVSRKLVYHTYTYAELTCHSSCSPADLRSYVWFKNGRRITKEQSSSYALKIPSVSVSPSGEVMEGSSVTLTCSSDAYPAATYTWYLEKQKLLNKEPQLVFSTILSSDSGEYYYGPKRPSVSVSPSAEIVEGSSVNLTCSSDANPAANYTWYKENQTLASPLHGPEDICYFPSISSNYRGNYHCKSENQHGELSYKSVFIDVQYGPKHPSVSVSPSAEIVEGSSVTLTCSSDANPAANYTWYKENEDSPKASGQIFTITDVRPEHSGDYSCEAQNRRGRQSSTLHLIVVAGTFLLTHIHCSPHPSPSSTDLITTKIGKNVVDKN